MLCWLLSSHGSGFAALFSWLSSCGLGLMAWFAGSGLWLGFRGSALVAQVLLLGSAGSGFVAVTTKVVNS